MPEIRTIADVCRVLTAQGYAAPSSTVDRHFKAGKFGRGRDGAFEEGVVLEYARVHLKRMETGKRQEVEDIELSRAKKEAEVEKLQEQAKYAKMKRLALEKKVVPRGLYERDLAARMAFFSGQLDAWIPQLAEDCVRSVLGESNSRAAAMVRLVEGGEGQEVALVGFVERVIPELVEVFQRRKAKWLKAFALENVHVVEMEGYIDPLGDEGQGDAAL